MLKTKNPRYMTASPANETKASKHLWEDFVRQVGAYARRVNITYRNVPMEERFESRRTKQDVATNAWYNQNNTYSR